MQRCSAFVLLFLAAVASGTADQTAGAVTDGAHQVAVVVSQVVREYLSGCHLVLAATTQHSMQLQQIIRQLPDGVGSVVVEAESLFDQDQPTQDHLLQGLWGEARHTCRALILHLTDDSLAYRFFETSALWLWPEARILIVGGRPDMKIFLHHPSIHNTKHILYLAVHLHKIVSRNTIIRRRTFRKAWDERVKVYRRCLYCNNGDMDVQEIRQWNLTSVEHHTDNIFLDKPEDFMGHKFDILAMPLFPFSNLRRISEEVGTAYTLLDSVDTRMLNCFTAQTNFTYEVREPWDGQWGIDLQNGNWTGVVGTLQHQQADFSLIIGLTPTRRHVLDYSIVFANDGLAIFSLKPELLPQHLAIFRPFIGLVWLILFVSVLVWSITLWLVQKAWSLMTGGRSLKLNFAVLYGWSVLMDEYSSAPSVNPTGQLLVGLWMLSCVILTNSYRSSLVAHLTVQDKMPAINSFQDLLARDGWGWGTSNINDASMLFFKYHPSSDIQKIHKEMQYAAIEEQFRRVLKGSYSHIAYKNPAMAIVVANLTDSRGYTPIHVSRTEYPHILGGAWAFRRGAPFRHRISTMMQLLIEGGHIDYWTEDIISSHMRKTRTERKNIEEKGKFDDDIFEVADRNVSLGLIHLQGAFYLLLLGCGLAILTWLGENFAGLNSSPHESLLLVKTLAQRHN